MSQPNGEPPEPAGSAAERAAYDSAAGTKLTESKAKVDAVRLAVSSGIDAGHLESSEQLERAQRATDTRLANVEFRLHRLRESDGEEWQELRRSVEDAWEDLAHSIRTLVARITDQSR